MGGIDEPIVERLAERYRVHAPELPGYGESTGEELLEDMLDFTLHGWDVVDALLGADATPNLVGHSMGAMIAAEMACIDNRRANKLEYPFARREGKLRSRPPRQGRQRSMRRIQVATQQGDRPTEGLAFPPVSAHGGLRPRSDGAPSAMWGR